MLLAALWLLQADQCNAQSACSDAESARSKCEQVERISIATGAAECQHRRVFYTCMLTEGCYEGGAACRNANGPVSCDILCEAEPILTSCLAVQPPPEDYYLCPHISKDSVATPAPTLEDFLAAPALPYTLTVWMAYRAANSADPVSLVPTFLADAVAVSLGSSLQLNPLAVVISGQISYSKAPLNLPGSEPPPVWAQHTAFLSLNIHIINVTDIQRMQSLSDITLLANFQSEAQNLLDPVEERLQEELNNAFPASSNLQLSRLEIHAQRGLVSEFPSFVETTTVVTTTVQDIRLQIQQWRAWRIRCMEGVVYRWEVSELEFWADACPERGGSERLSAGSARMTAFSSGSYDGNHSEEKAFDSDANFTRTFWLSNCTSCPAGTSWLGLAASLGTPAFRVACTKLLQGNTATNMCGLIVLEASDDFQTWEVRGSMVGLSENQSLCVPRTSQDFPSLQCGVLENGCGSNIEFGWCAGSKEVCQVNQCICQGRLEVTDPAFTGWQCGDAEDGCGGILRFGSCSANNATCLNHRCKEDIFAAAHWRLMCTGTTVSRWVVREVRFHADGLCVIAHTVFRRAGSSGTQYAHSPALNAFDGDESSRWISSCHGCKPREAWLSLQFPDPVVVRCVRVLQHPRTAQQCPTLSLEYSDDGVVWTERYQYGATGFTVGEDARLEATLDEDFSLQDVFAEERFAYMWRIACMEAVDFPWKVREFDFYDNEECSSSLRGAVDSVLHAASSSWPAENAYDQNEFTIWTTKCGQCSGSEDPFCACRPGEAYVGLRFLRRVRPRCFRILQLEEGKGLCGQLAIHFSDDTDPDQVADWTLRRSFDDVGSDMLGVLAPRGDASETNQAASWSAGWLTVSTLLFVAGCVG